jgi:hypothetical protein
MHGLKPIFMSMGGPQAHTNSKPPFWGLAGVNERNRLITTVDRGLTCRCILSATSGRVAVGAVRQWFCETFQPSCSAVPLATQLPM